MAAVSVARLNPAALALALLLGHEARITDEQWEDVRAMSDQRECRYLREMYVGEGVPTAVSIAPTPSGPWYPVNDVDEESRLRSMLGKVISRSGYECISEINRTAPQVTHHCPECEAAARELADIAAVLRTGSSGDTLLGKEVSRWIDTAHAAEQERVDLRAHPIVCACGDHIGYAERIGLSQDGAICGNCATGRSDYDARMELNTLKARLADLKRNND